MRTERGWGATESAKGSVPVRMVFGLLVATLGAIFLAQNLGWVESHDLLRRFWPAAFVAMGVAMLLQPDGRGSSRWWGAVPIVAGIWIFARQQDLLEIDFWQIFFPAILLFFGARLVWRAHRGPREGASQLDSRDVEDYVQSFAVLGGSQIRSHSKAFRGADLGAFMGGVVLDLRDATLEGEAVIDTFAMWAGIEIRVPPGWRVISKVVPVMGAFEDKTPPATTALESANARTIIIRGVVVMGGIEVKS